MLGKKTKQKKRDFVFANEFLLAFFFFFKLISFTRNIQKGLSRTLRFNIISVKFGES